MFCVLVIEHDQKLNAFYRSFLEKQGYEAVGASDASEALAAYEEHRIDLVLCDVALPSIDGFMVTEAIRFGSPEVPIIVMSDLDDFRSKQRAFTAGGDDFMVKPVDLNELLLRMGALLRRANITSKQRIVIGSAVLDSTTFTVVDGAASVTLPPKEFKMLFKLCASPGRIFSRRDIMDDVWGIHTKSNERTVDVHIKRLREKFKDNVSFRIETVRSVGYKAVATK